MCVQENVHVEAGGTLSCVDTVISMCISNHTLVCSSACNGLMNGTAGEAEVVPLVRRSFLPLTCRSGAEKKV